MNQYKSKAQWTWVVCGVFFSLSLISCQKAMESGKTDSGTVTGTGVGNPSKQSIWIDSSYQGPKEGNDVITYFLLMIRSASFYSADKKSEKPFTVELDLGSYLGKLWNCPDNTNECDKILRNAHHAAFGLIPDGNYNKIVFNTSSSGVFGENTVFVNPIQFSFYYFLNGLHLYTDVVEKTGDVTFSGQFAINNNSPTPAQITLKWDRFANCIASPMITSKNLNNGSDPATCFYGSKETAAIEGEIVTGTTTDKLIVPGATPGDKLGDAPIEGVLDPKTDNPNPIVTVPGSSADGGVSAPGVAGPPAETGTPSSPNANSLDWKGLGDDNATSCLASDTPIDSPVPGQIPESIKK